MHMLVEKATWTHVLFSSHNTGSHCLPFLSHSVVYILVSTSG